jgi:hypothetical protein
MHLASLAPRRFLLITVVCCWTIAPGLSRADEPLRWKFTAGEQLDYQMSQDMNMKMDAGPAGKLAITTGQSKNMTWNVKSVDEKGDAVIVQKITRIRMKMAAPNGQGFEYDTDSEEPAVGTAAMMAPTMEAMTDGEFTFTMTPWGDVRDTKMSDELLAALKNGPGGENGAVEQFTSMVSQVALVLPKSSLKPGEVWKTTIAVADPSGGKQSVETTYKFDGTRDVDGTTYAVIKPSMTMELANNPMMEMKMKEQKTDGEVLFDLGAGRLESTSINQNMTVDIVAAGQTMPGTIDQKIEVKVTPREDRSEMRSQTSEN